jgi:hypothetical protein
MGTQLCCALDPSLFAFLTRVAILAAVISYCLVQLQAPILMSVLSQQPFVLEASSISTALLNFFPSSPPSSSGR